MKRILSITTLAISLLLGSSITSLSQTTTTSSYTDYWSTQEGSYSPDYGSAKLTETKYSSPTSFSRTLIAKSTFKFNQNAINAIVGYYNRTTPFCTQYSCTDVPDPYYYTFDISLPDDNNTSLSASGNYYCTLPNCHFDMDDDPEPPDDLIPPFGNGYRDETEGTSLEPNRMLANVTYRFDAYFSVFRTSPVVNLEFGSQMSAPIGGEYDTKYFDNHSTRSYPW